METLQGFGTWRTIRRLGSGGQGEVFLARCLPLEVFKEADTRLYDRLRSLNRVTGNELSVLQHMMEVFDLFSAAPIAAVKVLHAPDKAKNPNTSADRFSRGMAALKDADHSAIVKVLDADFGGRWFAMEYHKHGPISTR